MVKRIRKSELDETWMIFTRTKIDGVEYQGPIQRLEKITVYASFYLAF